MGRGTEGEGEHTRKQPLGTAHAAVPSLPQDVRHSRTWHCLFEFVLGCVHLLAPWGEGVRNHTRGIAMLQPLSSILLWWFLGVLKLLDLGPSSCTCPRGTQLALGVLLEQLALRL